ncbi:hypothetical protein E2C01_046830 [Portunus trituberculatus]|uniref:Uncharacterized protein n=1 Tax=Portunus trituberculatus TaxID=210409 RepID=A0A5B7G5W0_PORTR|nr:hypothetical protein [Portunus trituberculatus]
MKENKSIRKHLKDGTSYLKAHLLGNRCPELRSSTYTRTVDRIRTRALGDPSDPKTRKAPLYHLYPLISPFTFP